MSSHSQLEDLQIMTHAIHFSLLSPRASLVLFFIAFIYMYTCMEVRRVLWWLCVLPLYGV